MRTSVIVGLLAIAGLVFGQGAPEVEGIDHMVTTHRLPHRIALVVRNPTRASVDVTVESATMSQNDRTVSVAIERLQSGPARVGYLEPGDPILESGPSSRIGVPASGALRIVVQVARPAELEPYRGPITQKVALRVGARLLTTSATVRYGIRHPRF